MAIYFDNSATTRVDPEVVKEMLPFFSEYYGNISSIHSIGRQVRPYEEQARKSVAKLINATPDEIVFTASGSESDNLAIIATARAYKHKGKHIITSSIEHKAVLETFKFLENYEGFEVTYLPVDKYGLIDMEYYKNALRDDTILVSCMLANNEIGTIEPIKEMAALASSKGAIFHTDAVQAVGKMHIDVNELGVDLLTFSGHKIYAPKGIGVLYVDIELREKLKPIIHGGQQEGGLRAGTENIPYISLIRPPRLEERGDSAGPRGRKSGAEMILLRNVSAVISCCQSVLCFRQRTGSLTAGRAVSMSHATRRNAGRREVACRSVCFECSGATAPPGGRHVIPRNSQQDRNNTFPQSRK